MSTPAPKLDCPSCSGSSNLKVISSRTVLEGDPPLDQLGQITRRVRHCRDCDWRWTTTELSEDLLIHLLERDHSRGLQVERLQRRLRSIDAMSLR